MDRWLIGRDVAMCVTVDLERMKKAALWQLKTFGLVGRESVVPRWQDVRGWSHRLSLPAINSRRMSEIRFRPQGRQPRYWYVPCCRPPLLGPSTDCYRMAGPAHPSWVTLLLLPPPPTLARVDSLALIRVDRSSEFDVRHSRRCSAASQGVGRFVVRVTAAGGFGVAGSSRAADAADRRTQRLARRKRNITRERALAGFRSFRTFARTWNMLGTRPSPERSSSALATATATQTCGHNSYG